MRRLGAVRRWGATIGGVGLLLGLPSVGSAPRVGASLAPGWPGLVAGAAARLPAGIRIVASGDFATLERDGRDLLALRRLGPAATPSETAAIQGILERIDPASGRVLARTAPLQFSSGGYVVGGVVALQRTGPSASAPSTLELLDPATPAGAAHRGASRPAPGRAIRQRALVWLQSDRGCRLRHLDPSTGSTSTVIRLPLSNCVVLAGHKGALYVAGRYPRDGLDKVDETNGKVLARQPALRAGGVMSFADAGGHLFVIAGSLKFPTPLRVFAASDLHLVAQLDPPATSGKNPCDTGMPFFGCPGWVSYAAGVIWGGGGGSGTVGCFDPVSLTRLGLEHRPAQPAGRLSSRRQPACGDALDENAVTTSGLETESKARSDWTTCRRVSTGRRSDSSTGGRRVLHSPVRLPPALLHKPDRRVCVARATTRRSTETRQITRSRAQSGFRGATPSVARVGLEITALGTASGHGPDGIECHRGQADRLSPPSSP